VQAARFDWIEALYNPFRRRSARDYRSPLKRDALQGAANEVALITRAAPLSGKRGQVRRAL
jgi:hypothetical protein